MQHKHPKTGQTTAKEETPLQMLDLSLPANFARQIWLHYFNNYLRKRHIISEEEWRKMRRLIEKN